MALKKEKPVRTRTWTYRAIYVFCLGTCIPYTSYGVGQILRPTWRSTQGSLCQFKLLGFSVRCRDWESNPEYPFCMPTPPTSVSDLACYHYTISTWLPLLDLNQGHSV
jgi:hypothetical protein